MVAQHDPVPLTHIGVDAYTIPTDAPEYDVRWFEEPVSSDDLYGLRLMRDRSLPASATYGNWRANCATRSPAKCVSMPAAARCMRPMLPTTGKCRSASSCRARRKV